ncbi:MAG: FitA-like ribbon-helix-helix domain-containing protein [Candidatus Alkanophagales archaeon]
MATIYARIGEELKEKLRREAERNGVSISEQVRMILEGYF